MKKIEEAEELIEKWDFKRIVVGLGIFSALVGLGLYMLSANNTSKPAKNKATLGARAKEEKLEKITPPPIPSKEEVSRIISEAKEVLSAITSDNIVSSQKEIQTIIKELQQLQGGKKQPVDVICDLVCKDK